MTERDIFLEALDKSSPEERRTFLDRTCGADAKLRSRLERLLKSHEKGDSLLDHPILGDSQVGPVTAADHSSTRVESGSLRLDFLAPSEKPGCLGILGQYEILEVVAHGGMGIVLKGHDTKLNRIVAIKVLSPDIATIPMAHKRFLREARAAAAVSHDHVVTIYAVEEQPVPHLAMEFIDGCTLQEKIDNEGQLELKEVLRIGRQIAAGLVAAHEQGLIHRDIKPGNILLQNSVERVQITDFGIARATADVEITLAGEVTGTPQYMSPEQAKSRPVDHRSDLFSLGSVLYAMCAGRSPFRAETPLAAIRRVCDDQPRPLRENNPEIPEWLAAIIDKLLSKNPDDRFQTAAEVADLLGRHLAHLQDPGATAFPGVIQTAARPTKRKLRLRRWLTAAAVLLVGLVGFGFAEATGVTNLTATVIRIATGEGTLVIEVDDPTVQVSLDGENLSITGAGIQELKLRPGQYQFQAIKDGEPVKQELVNVTRGDRQVVRVGLESSAVPTQKKESKATDYKSTPDGAITEVRRFEGYQGPIHSLAFAPNGEFFVSSGEGTESKPIVGARVWNIKSGHCVRTLGTRGIRTLAVSPDSRLVAAGTYVDGIIELFDVSSGSRTQELRGHTDLSWALCFSPDGSRLLSGSRDGTARLWNISTGEELARVDLPSQVGAVHVFQESGGLLNVGKRGLFLWNLASDDEPRLITSSIYFHNLDVSPDGKWVLCSWNADVKILDISSGQQIWSRHVESDRVTEVRFSPSGKAVFAGDNDGRLYVWDIKSDREIARMEHQNHVTTFLDVSRDGRYLISGGGWYWSGKQSELDGDYAIRLWRLPESVWPDETKTVEKDAFVALGNGGDEVGKFPTLAEAVLGSSAGDTIEIRGNGPYVTNRIAFRHPLTIRAGAGYRPIITDDPQQELEGGTFLMTVDSPLVLEGLEIQTRAAVSDLLISYAPLLATNCRFLNTVGSHALVATSYTTFMNSTTLKNCQLIAPLGAAFGAWSESSSLQLTLDNCILVGNVALDDYGNAERVCLEHNTVVAPSTGYTLIFVNRYAVATEPAPQPIRIIASNNVFDPAANFFFFAEGVTPDADQDASQLETFLTGRFVWHEQHNLFRNHHPYLEVGIQGKSFGVTQMTLSDWNEFWGIADTGSQEGTIRYAAGDMLALAMATPDQVTPADFRLRPDSAGYQAGPDGKDLGADVDLVGPGEAYERWKQTVDYQEWQKEIRELMQAATGDHQKAVSEAPAADESPGPTNKDDQTPIENSAEKQSGASDS